MPYNIGFDTSRVPVVLVWGGATLVAGFFLGFVGNLLWQGLPHLSWQFLTTDSLDAGRQGGIAPIIVSTGFILTVCLVVALPIGLGTAAFLAEFTTKDGKWGRFIRRSLDVLSGVPSIIFGLFGNALFCHVLGLGFSILSGGLTLACMVLPLLIRITEEGFRAVSHDYRLTAAALGCSRTSTLLHVLVPLAAPGFLVGVILSLGRAMAETAALIFTSGYVDRMPESLFDSGRALSIHIFDLSMNVPGGDRNAYTTALLLVGCLIMLNGLVTWLTRHWVRQRLGVA